MVAGLKSRLEVVTLGWEQLESTWFNDSPQYLINNPELPSSSTLPIYRQMKLGCLCDRGILTNYILLSKPSIEYLRQSNKGQI